ncbi:AAA family ATPase [Nitrosopumilus sp.]|nr:AAA family ATPase [Nitrosopumilus sp.]
MVTFHQSYGYEEFIEGIRPEVKEGTLAYPIKKGVFWNICNAARVCKKDHVIIIDEINRGNISKIFGELITIIENDKRGDEVTLSYSGKKFSVPENVYVIGTMNTADQSLTQIDAALKRRFSTVEVMPNSLILEKLIEQSGIGLVGLPKLLDKINDKIRVHRTRHNQIGHSYFMHDDNVIDSIKELQFVFATDVIPLLQDYFYADEDALKDVLDNQFIDWGDNETGDLLTDWQDDDGKFKAAIKSAFDIDL